MHRTATMSAADTSHYEFPLHKLNSGSFHHQGVLPLPPADGLSIRINTYEDVPEEPRFNPEIHLDLRRPSYVRLFPDFEKAERAPPVNSSEGSRFAYSAPFQVCLNNRMDLCAGL